MTRSLTISLLLLFFSIAAKGGTCEEFHSYATDELIEYRTVLTDEKADPFERLAAFERLICSDNPNIRNYAIKQGLNPNNDPLVRNQVLLGALMQKSRISVKLSETKDITEHDKKFIQQHAAVYVQNISFRDSVKGCVGFYYKECRTDYSASISGDLVEFNYSPVFGEFKLSETGDLVGYLRAKADGKHSKIPAKIALF